VNCYNILQLFNEIIIILIEINILTINSINRGINTSEKKMDGIF